MLKLARADTFKIVKCSYYHKESDCCSFILLRLESEERDLLCVPGIYLLVFVSPRMIKKNIFTGKVWCSSQVTFD